MLIEVKAQYYKLRHCQVDNFDISERGEHVFSLERKMHYLVFPAFMPLTANLPWAREYLTCSVNATVMKGSFASSVARFCEDIGQRITI